MTRVSNPLATAYDAERDVTLLQTALTGDRKALDELVRRHQNFVYNIAIKFLGDVEEAKDATQDIFIRLITNLAAYDPAKGQFRTWLYRIAFNHLLDHKQSCKEERIVDFGQFFDFIAAIPSDDAPVAEHLGEEAKVKCMTGMLLCVPREDRLLYVVGDLFGIDHTLGSEIFGISKANFRKKLSRIRGDLRQWMNNRCGLVNKANPCRCVRKTRGFIERGIVDPEALVWNRDFAGRIESYTQDNFQEVLRQTDTVYSKLYRQHPFKVGGNGQAVVDEILAEGRLKEMLDL